MQIPGLGPVVKDNRLGYYVSEPVVVPVLGGTLCRFAFESYGDDPQPDDFHSAVQAFLALDSSVLTTAAPAIFAYYRDIMDDVLAEGDDEWYVEIKAPEDVFDHIQWGSEPTIARDSFGDQHVYVSLECECDWEPEHGLQIVLRDGRTVTKIGPYNGHLTNVAAYGDESLKDVVYRSRSRR